MERTYILLCISRRIPYNTSHFPFSPYSILWLDVLKLVLDSVYNNGAGVLRNSVRTARVLDTLSVFNIRLPTIPGLHHYCKCSISVCLTRFGPELGL